MPEPTTDERHMKAALALAEKGRGGVEPNPVVGAVVVAADGAVVGEGFHRTFGQDHAEVVALAAAGEKARGGTLYVTLEPCGHFGQTPPCAAAVIAAGITRVVAALMDPFPQVSGDGFGQLRTAGIEVTVGVGEAEARHQNAPYLKLVRTGRPWVHVKWAMTLDGRIATRGGDSQWISSEEARARAHEVRGRMDAILVGRGTVMADNPQLTARPAGPRVATRVILTASGELPERCKLRQSAGEVPVLVLTAEGNEGKLAGWIADGAEVVPIPLRGERFHADRILAELGRRKMTHVLVEGGPVVLGSFLDAHAADEVHVYIAPKIFGGEGALAPVGGVGVEWVMEALGLGRVTARGLGGDVYVNGRINRAS